MDNGEYPDFTPSDLEHHPVVANPEFPVSLEGFSQRFPILMGGFSKARLDRGLDAFLQPLIQPRDVLLDLGVI